MFLRDGALDISLFRQLAAARQQDLPRLFVHDDKVWRAAHGRPAPARVDGNGDLHMSLSDLLLLKQEVPVKEIGRVREDCREFAFALLPHHFEGGIKDVAAPVTSLREGKEVLRDALGFDPLDGSPKGETLQ